MAFDNVERPRGGRGPEGADRASWDVGLEASDDFHSRGGECDARIVVAHAFIITSLASLASLSITMDFQVFSQMSPLFSFLMAICSS